MTNTHSRFDIDTTKFINPHQLGGIECYTMEDGPARGVKALWVNTGSGLRYRLLADRGLDIDQAFFNADSLAYLSHRGVVRASHAYERGIDWLKSFPGGLVTSCGPFNIGAATQDEGEDLALHGAHSNTPGTIESIVQPDPANGRFEMAVTAIFRYGRLFGPCVDLRRTVRSTLGESIIDIIDEFQNVGNIEAPHAWLLHINFGYPLLDAGSEFCYDAKRVEARGDPESKRLFAEGRNYKRVPQPLERHRGTGEGFAYFYPKAQERTGKTTVAIVNSKLSLGVAVHYNTKEFGRCGNWQHWGEREFVAALEPMSGGVEGRDKDRERGWMQTLAAGARKTYRYQLEVVTERKGIEALRRIR